MTNKEIANKFNLLGKIMELHDENPFKIRSYANAYINIRKQPDPLSEMSPEETSHLSGIGKAISEKIYELVSTGEMQTLNRYLELTPSGIVEMLSIKGFGPKKIKTIWKELGIESIGELIYAVNENRLIDLKGFGQKTQDSLKAQLEYYLDSVGKWHYGAIENNAIELVDLLKSTFEKHSFQLTGPIHRKCDIIERIDIITSMDEKSLLSLFEKVDDIETTDSGLTYKSFPLQLHYSNENNFIFDWAKQSSDAAFWEKLNIKQATYDSLENLWQENGHPHFIPEFCESENIDNIDSYPSNADAIVQLDDIKGCIHNHSTFSDGMNTMQEMIEAAFEKGHEYFVMTDHSKSAFYANGLQIERLNQQLDELTKLDQSQSDIRIFTGIESDILNDGSLDYPDDVLAELDVVIASVHSNLKMNEQKATQRLITAIQNPYTSILGHPTGRLLLSRQGYPIDHKAIIEACSDYNVAIEINANPYRLDIDWRWIQYAMEKDVLISINPDAHSIKGIDDTYYGVCSARKGALSKYACLNAFDLEEFEEWLMEQHEKRG